MGNRDGFKNFAGHSAFRVNDGSLMPHCVGQFLSAGYGKQEVIHKPRSRWWEGDLGCWIPEGGSKTACRCSCDCAQALWPKCTSKRFLLPSTLPSGLALVGNAHNLQGQIAFRQPTLITWLGMMFPLFFQKWQFSLNFKKGILENQCGVNQSLTWREVQGCANNELQRKKERQPCICVAPNYLQFGFVVVSDTSG